MSRTALSEAREAAKALKEKTPIDPWKEDDRILDPDEEPLDTPAWAEMDGRKALPKSGIIAVSARPKQGKSLSVYALLSYLLKGESLDVFKPIDIPRLIMIFDFEMSRNTLLTRYKKIREMLGKGLCRRFLIVPMKLIKKSDRRRIIEDMTASQNPDIVVLDTITRMGKDFNDSKECDEICTWLNAYAESRSVIAIIHDKATSTEGDEKMKGHLGSLIDEYQSEHYRVLRKDKVYYLKAVSARDTDVDEDAEPMKFTLDGNGHYADASARIDAISQKRADDMRSYFESILDNDDELNSNALKERICKSKKVKDRVAQTILKDAVELDVLACRKDGRFNLYKLQKAYGN